jgi:hypothetical protein
MSLLSKIKKGLKKVGKVATVIYPALGAGLSKTNQMQLQMLTAGMGSPVALSTNANPLAEVLGLLGTKVGIPSSLGTQVASSFFDVPKLPSLPTLDDARSYAAWKIAPDSLLQNLRFDAAGNPIKKRRRMNPLNARAAKRAIRRIKAVRKITAGIERALPKAKARNWHAHAHRHR